MARVPKKTAPEKKPIDKYEHKGKKRLNNPPVGLVTPEIKPIAVLQKLSADFSISDQELARVLRVSTGIISRWNSGEAVIPPETVAVVKAADAALARMLAIFRPERLPDVIRQKVELFDGRSALDLILEGRIEEVADSYDEAFAYQG